MYAIIMWSCVLLSITILQKGVIKINILLNAPQLTTGTTHFVVLLNLKETLPQN